MAELKKLNLNQSTTPTLESKKTPVQNQPNQTMEPTKPTASKKIAILPILIAIIAGAGTGYALYRFLPSSVTGTPTSTTADASTVKKGDIIGVQDEKTFRDSAEGVLEKGGLEGEGSHKLLRPGGPAQTVYLTSSVIDLDELVGHKVKVWGETFAAQTAGWLMDVGRVQVVELNAEKPE